MSATDQTAYLMLRHPAGELRLSAPANVPLAELIGDLLDAARLPDSDGWTLELPGGTACPLHRSLAELGSPDAIVLYDASGAVPADHSETSRSSDIVTAEDPEDEQPSRVPDAAPCSPNVGRQRPEVSKRRLPRDARREPGRQERMLSLGQGDVARPVRAGAEQLLPARSSLRARIRELLAALSPSWDAREAEALGAADPDMFTRAARRPASVRIREAWSSSDYERLLEAATLMPCAPGCQTIAVISPKGGVGKTAITALLGSLIAFIRRDRTIAIDTNPDFGSLGRRLVPEHGVFIDDLLAGPLANEHCSPMDLAVHLGRGPDGLMVAPAPTDRKRAQRLDETAYRTLFTRLAGLAEVLVLDCGTGLDSPAARAALAAADQLVLVCDGEPDTASLICDRACKSLLEGVGRPVFLVANKLTSRSRIDLGAFEREMSFATGIVEIPHDQAGADSLQRSRFSWAHRAPGSWRVPLRELAALIALSWTAPTRPTGG